MSSAQTSEEKELIAKWNAGDYSAEGWIDNTEGLTEEALNGLAEYNAKNFTDSLGIDEKEFNVDAASGFESESVDIPENFTSSGDAETSFNKDAVLFVITLNRPRPVTFAIVRNDFGSGFTAFAAVFMRQGVGRFRVRGELFWVASEVSNKLGPAFLQNEPNNRIRFYARTPAIPYRARLYFVGLFRYPIGFVLRGRGNYIKK